MSKFTDSAPSQKSDWEGMGSEFFPLTSVDLCRLTRTVCHRANVQFFYCLRSFQNYHKWLKQPAFAPNQFSPIEKSALYLYLTVDKPYTAISVIQA